MKQETLVLIILALIPLTIIGVIVLNHFQKPADFDKWCINNGGSIDERYKISNASCATSKSNCWKLCDFNGSMVNFYDKWRVPNASFIS